jgi:hypothetical protein
VVCNGNLSVLMNAVYGEGSNRVRDISAMKAEYVRAQAREQEKPHERPLQLTPGWKFGKAAERTFSKDFLVAFGILPLFLGSSVHLHQTWIAAKLNSEKDTTCIRFSCRFQDWRLSQLTTAYRI